MLRSIAVIVAAIRLLHPEMPEPEARRYAAVLREEAHEHHFDPLTGVAMIHTESGFQPDAVSASGEDYGLAQIRARYIGACRKDPRPKRQPGKACREVKARLLRPEGNIREMARLITMHRKVCRKHAGSARFSRWLASYQGRNYPRKGRWCVPGKGTWRVIRLQQRLAREAPRVARQAERERQRREAAEKRRNAK